MFKNRAELNQLLKLSIFSVVAAISSRSDLRMLSINSSISLGYDMPTCLLRSSMRSENTILSLSQSSNYFCCNLPTLLCRPFLSLIFPDDDGGRVVKAQASLSQSRAAPSIGGLVNKNVASTGPQQIHIGTLVGNLHIGDVINVSATTSNNSAAPSQSGSDDREGDGLFSKALDQLIRNMMGIRWIRFLHVLFPPFCNVITALPTTAAGVLSSS